MPELTFQEWGRARVVPLSSDEIRVLAKHKDAVRCDATAANKYRVGPLPGFVGSLRLSDRTTIVIHPRLPIESFASLVSLAYDDAMMPARLDATTVSTGDLSAWCISQIVAEAQKLCRYHLRPDYIELDDRRTSPRGKLVFDGLSPDYRGGIRCVTDQFTYDTDLNRLIKAGLMQVRRYPVAGPWRSTISRILTELSSITLVAPRQIPSLSLKSTLSSRYRPLAMLLNLALANKGSEFAAGNIDVSAFFFRLHELFERAVYNAFRRVVVGLTAVRQPPERNAATHISGAPNLGITFRPDVGIARPTVGVKSRHGVWTLIVDAKYKNPIQAGRFRPSFSNENVYQIMAYCRVFSAPGLLLYPRVDRDVDISYKVGDAQFKIRTIDLKCADLKGEFDRIARAAISENIAGI